MQESLFRSLHTNAREKQDTFSPPYYIGTGGWSYQDWIGSFYPSYIERSRWIEFYASRFPAVEVDSTFYSMPSADAVNRWNDLTPENFTFTFKVPRIITHEKQLSPPSLKILDQFLVRLSPLDKKLGPILLQFPPSFHPGYFDRLHHFLPRLPADFRFALEIRDPQWLNSRFFTLLRANNIALALVDSAYIPKQSTLTADFTYIRWIGENRQRLSNFSHTQIDKTTGLRDWATVMVKKFEHNNIDMYGFFNNHFAGFSPASVSLLYSLVTEMNS